MKGKKNFWEKFSLGSQFRYGIRRNLEIHGLISGFIFVKLREQIGIVVSPSTI